MMVSRTKKFDRKAYAENDGLARDWSKLYLTRIGARVKDNPDPYGVDLVTPDFYVECEIKRVWTEYQWPAQWKHLQIPYRKKKFTKLPTVFFVFNSDGSRLAMCDNVGVLESPLRVIANAKVKRGELFYCVPMERVTLVDTLGGVINGRTDNDE